VQLLIVMALLLLRSLVYRGPAATGKG
jgi:hypothetical protein